MQVLVRGAWRGTLYLDPVSGMEQGRRGENEGFVNLLYGLHSALWMERTGKAVLACAALSYLALCISGLVLWWPRTWPPSLRIAWRKGLSRTLFDTHRTCGAVLALALALSIGTGAYLAWRPIGGWITWLSGAPPTKAPALPPGTGPALPLDELAARARAAFPEGSIGYFLYTPDTDRPLAVRMHVPDDPHPNGRSTVWLDPRSGAVLAKHRWNELDPGTRINSVIYPLHTGELGGAPWQAGVAILGLALSGLGGSGIWLWWRRRAARRRAVGQCAQVLIDHPRVPANGQDGVAEPAMRGICVKSRMPDSGHPYWRCADRKLEVADACINGGGAKLEAKAGTRDKADKI
jgi:uncharacterized iron-regulated membrane protein